MTSNEFKKKTGVNSSTLEKLNKYLNLIDIWQKKFNLISQESLKFVWERHMLDSYQIIKILGKNNKVLDIGSGAGFPAIVCSICSDNYFYLVEANKKKNSFLNEVKSKLKLKNIFIYHDRLENIKFDQNFDYISARAVTSLDKLIKYAFEFSTLKTQCIFLKGKKVFDEINSAKKDWFFTIKLIQSITNKDGKILLIKNIAKK